ncbi:autotransporter outer membrane beta-barrel domain-containing protein [Halodesulfovibrio sp. MK-HDV]|uniref:autotransporter outer membrane beta-barrel domain-containing protein n=1 Tax=Halodesulfovibrio sp. MK-HDV TaxID=2599925 RepID=UPI0013710644|nr:autotransporter outer membrane beta-barrel domain-containing protein [Halodesulfovibrio sp. MK-HDV]KAF1073751.1 hypothetical protein MKHDV_03372 [Halodesulfovibrio sp. MK-HDV]
MLITIKDYAQDFLKLLLLSCILIVVPTKMASAGQLIQSLEKDYVNYDNIYAPANIYGEKAGIGVVNPSKYSITNYGTISFVEINSDSSPEVYGIVAHEMIKNYGDITVSSLSASTASTKPTDASATALGIYSSIGVENHGDITIQARGGESVSLNTISSSSETEGVGLQTKGVITNHGAISVSSISGNSSLTYTSPDIIGYSRIHNNAKAYGIMSKSNVTNYGNISSLAVSGITHIVADDFSLNYDKAYAYGIKTLGNVTSYGSIFSTAKGGRASTNATVFTDANAHAYAYGIYTDGTVTNYGNITATALGGTAFNNVSTSNTARCYGSAEAKGIYSEKAVTNYGTVIAKAVGGKATYTTNKWGSAVADADAVGIYSKGNVSSYGDIIVTAQGGNAIASDSVIIIDKYNTGTDAEGYAKGIIASGDVLSTGNITVTATGGVKKRAGVLTSDVSEATGIQMNATGRLDSRGIISASAFPASGYAFDPTKHIARQVYIAKGVTTLTGYGMKFSNSNKALTSEFGGSIHVNNDASAAADLLFQQAVLYAHQGVHFAVGVYEIPMIEKGATHSDATDDQFVDVVASHPDIKAALTAGNSGRLQQVTFTYAPKSSPSLLSTRAAADAQMKSQYTIANELSNMLFASARPSSVQEKQVAGINDNTSHMVASSDATVIPTIESSSDNTHTLFLRPIVATSEDTSTYGYDSRTAGFVLGYTHKFSDAFYLGGHAGYTRSNVDYTDVGTGYSDREEDIDTYYGGIHAIGRYDKNWIFTGMSSFFIGDNTYSNNDPALKENATYSSYALRTKLTGGYLFAIGENQFLPELGLTHTWQHHDEYSTKNTTTFSTTYGSLDDNELYGTASIKWLRKFKVGNNWLFTPQLGIGITQVLTDGEISVTQRAAAAAQLMVDSEDKTTITPELSLTMQQDDFSLTLGYNGGFSDTTRNNQFWVQGSVDF